MSRKKSPVEQKQQLIKDLATLQTKLEKIDNQRAQRIGELAKQYHLVNLTDAVLKAEFEAIRDRHQANDVTSSSMHPANKNTSASAPDTATS